MKLLIFVFAEIRYIKHESAVIDEHVGDSSEGSKVQKPHLMEVWWSQVNQGSLVNHQFFIRFVSSLIISKQTGPAGIPFHTLSGRWWVTGHNFQSISFLFSIKPSLWSCSCGGPCLPQRSSPHQLVSWFKQVHVHAVNSASFLIWSQENTQTWFIA